MASDDAEPNQILAGSLHDACEPADPNARIEPEAQFISATKSPEHQKRDIVQYLSGQANGEEVLHLEKITSEVLYGRDHAVWDVRTDKNEWWVVTNPTNLYLKRTFPSVDMLLSFHVGLAARIFGAQSAVGEAEDPAFLRTLRRLDIVSQALDDAEEAEDYQAVGMRCRECLLSLVRDLATPEMVPEGEERPQRSNFIRWSELIAEWCTPTGRLTNVRSYLKAIAKETWQHVSWLTHTTSAIVSEAAFAYRATSNVVAAFVQVSRDRDAARVERCQFCDSYQLFEEFRPAEWAYVTICEVCGAEGPLRPEDGASQHE